MHFKLTRNRYKIYVTHEEQGAYCRSAAISLGGQRGGLPYDELYVKLR